MKAISSESIVAKRARLQRAYNFMSPVAQDVMLSMYGLAVQWQRYGGGHAYFKRLEEHDQWSRERLRRLQLGLLRERAVNAIERVPAYRGMTSALSDVRSATAAEQILDLFPVLTKEHVRAKPEEFVPEGLGRRRLLVGLTGGTTGTPLKLYRTRDGLRRHFAFFLQDRKRRGLTQWSRTATLMGRMVVPRSQSKPPFWRHSAFTNNLLFSPHHLSPDTVSAYATMIAGFRPEQIVCFPSCGAIVAEAMSRLGLHISSVKAVFTTAETLQRSRRRRR